MDDSYRQKESKTVTTKFEIDLEDYENRNHLVIQKIFQEFSNVKKIFMLVWTTTPWTLPSNLALSVGNDIEYDVTENDGEIFISAKQNC